MELSLFKNKDRFFTVVLFLEKSDLDKKINLLKNLGDQKNISLIVQPCPFEGIEFLYRVGKDLVGHYASLEKDLFWEAIELKKSTPPEIIKEVAEHHFNYLAAILEQDPLRVQKEIMHLKDHEKHFVKPIAGG